MSDVYHLNKTLLLSCLNESIHIEFRQGPTPLTVLGISDDYAIVKIHLSQMDKVAGLGTPVPAYNPNMKIFQPEYFTD